MIFPHPSRMLAPALLVLLAACAGTDKPVATETASAAGLPTGNNTIALNPDANDARLAQLKLPQGFRINYWARGVENARAMARGDKGTIFVGSREAGAVYALVDRDADGRADVAHKLMSGLELPTGVAFRDGALYVAEVSKIWRLDGIEDKLANPGKPVLVTDKLPKDRHHGWKYIAFGPDGKLYVPVGAPCNICDKRQDNPVYASITRMNADGSGQEIYAHGVRNTVGFTWHPETKELWFTDNGRDMMGDNMPGCELNYAPKPGMDFGYPYIHQGNVPDPEFGKGKRPADYTAPAQVLGPHVAPLGLKFVGGSMFPAAYQGSLLIAEHGSWNRSQPIGYRVMQVTLSGNRSTGYKPFIEGWLQKGEAWGRPVDLLQLPDGSFLLSDDENDCIYRITYSA